MPAVGDPSIEEIVLNVNLTSCSFAPSGDGLQGILILYVWSWIKNKIWGGIFGAHLYEGAKEVSKKGPCACPWCLPLSLLPLSFLPPAREGRAVGYGRRGEQKEGLGGFTAMSGLAPSPLLGLPSLLGFHNSVFLPIWGSWVTFPKDWASQFLPAQTPPEARCSCHWTG